MQDFPDAKKPCKGILKSSSSFDKPGASFRKSAKFDELNVLQTYHPQDKDYGHMKIDEPKTPYNYMEPDVAHQDQLDANLLAEKLQIAANAETPSFGADDISDEEFPETDEEKVRRLEFERRRKAHYNEFEVVRLARKLIEEELEEEEEEEIPIDYEGNQKKSSSEFLGSNEGHGSRVDHDTDLNDPDVGESNASVDNKSANITDRTMDIDQDQHTHSAAPTLRNPYNCH